MSDGYVSPLLARLKEEEQLTLENLAVLVPIAQEGREAEILLKEDPSHPDRRELHRKTREGEKAKEKLVLMALPLIKSLAYKELTRRQAWNSRVSFEDIVSEGIGGFIRGIYAYNPKGNHKSATNYLGQWIMTDMKRNVEELDHDFSVPYEAIERQRKIRAIRSRLASELGREPTDEEIIEAAAEGYKYNDNMMGRVDKSKAKGSGARRRVITQKHIDEERNMFRRTGAVLPSDHLVGGDEDSNVSTLEALSAISITHADDTPAPSLYGSSELTSIEAVDAQVVRTHLSELIETAFSRIGVGQIQRDIIRRKFGLHPYGEEQKVRDISLHTRVPKHKISRIVSLFSTEMGTPGGVFHQLLSEMDEDEADALGLGWITSALGEFTQPSNKKPHKHLTDPFYGEDPAPRITTASAQDGVLATFYCPTEHNHFTMNYRNENEIPPTRPCPRCGTESARV